MSKTISQAHGPAILGMLVQKIYLNTPKIFHILYVHFFTCIEKRTKESAAVHLSLLQRDTLRCSQKTGDIGKSRSLYPLAGYSAESLIRSLLSANILLPTIDRAARLCEMATKQVFLKFPLVNFFCLIKLQR